MKKLLLLIFITMMSINAFPGDGEHGGGSSALDLFENIFHGSASEQLVKMPSVVDVTIETHEYSNGTVNFFTADLSTVVSFILEDERVLTSEDIAAIVVETGRYSLDYTLRQVHNIKKIILTCGEVVELNEVVAIETLVEVESER